MPPPSSTPPRPHARVRSHRPGSGASGRPGAAAVLAVLAASAVSTASSPTRPQSATDRQPLVARWARPGLYLPVGVSAAGTYRAADGETRGLALGSEVSVVSFDQVGPPGTWLGGYADATWDLAAAAFRHGAGPQFGIAMLGLDLGYLGELCEGRYRPGFAARGLLTMGPLSLFGRYGRLYGEAGQDDEDVAEFGVLAKFPWLLSGGGRADDVPVAAGTARPRLAAGPGEGPR